MRDALLSFLKWRVLDPVSGVVVIDPLPHVHASNFEVIAAQPGMTGSAGIGNFSIPLFSPADEQYAWASVDYAKLNYGQRVEAYQTAAPSEAQGAWGDPVFTGVITRLPKDLGTAAIEGFDSLYLLQMARTDKIVNKNVTTDDLFKYALKGHSLVFGDDFTGTLGAFTNDGGFTQTTNDGFSVVQSPSPSTGDGLLYTTTSYGNTNYSDMIVHAPWHIKCNNAGSAAAEAGVIAAVADANNYVLGRAYMRYVSATRYEVDMEIWQRSGGAYARKVLVSAAGVQTPTTHVSSQDFRGGIHLIGVQTSTTTYAWILRVNQIEAACRWDQTVGVGAPTGAIGIRSNKAGVASAELSYCSGVVFLNKTAIFQQGSITAGTNSIAQNYSFAPNIDMVNDALSAEGSKMRKNPKAGLNNDTLDFKPTPGTDLSGTIKFAEGINIGQCAIEPNALPLATATILSHAPGPDNAGQTYWFNIPKIKTYGYLLDADSAPFTADMLAVRKRASQLLSYRTTPDQAKRLTVLRDPDHALASGSSSPTGLAWRELDKVEVHAPRLGLSHQPVTVLSFKYQEGSPTMEITVDQWPTHFDTIPRLEELQRRVEAMHLGTPEATSSAVGSGSGGTYNRMLTLPIDPYKMSVYQAGAQTMTDGGLTVVHFDSITYDSRGKFDVSTYHYTVPISGYYVTTARCEINPVNVVNRGQTGLLTLYANGVLVKVGNHCQIVQGAVNRALSISSTLSASLYFNADDVLEVDWYQDAGGNGTTNPTAPYVYWDLHLISA